MTEPPALVALKNGVFRVVGFDINVFGFRLIGLADHGNRSFDTVAELQSAVVARNDFAGGFTGLERIFGMPFRIDVDGRIRRVVHLVRLELDFGIVREATGIDLNAQTGAAIALHKRGHVKRIGRVVRVAPGRSKQTDIMGAHLSAPDFKFGFSGLDGFRFDDAERKAAAAITVGRYRNSGFENNARP